MILNPWRKIRELESEIEFRELMLDDMAARLREAERDAFHKAADWYSARTRHLQAERDRLLENAVQISNLTPPKIFISDEDAAALRAQLGRTA